MWPPETGHDWEKLESPEARIERGKGYSNFMRSIRIERMFTCERCGQELIKNVSKNGYMYIILSKLKLLDI